MLEGVAEGEEHLVALVADLHDVGNVIVQSGVAVNVGQEGLESIHDLHFNQTTDMWPYQYTSTHSSRLNVNFQTVCPRV